MNAKNTKRMRKLTAVTLASATALLGATRASAVTELIPNDPPTADNGMFGCSIAANSSVALVGAFYKNGTYNQQGAAYLFDLSGNELQKLTYSDPAYNDCFGYSVALNDSVALVGAYQKTDAYALQGVAYLFDLNGNEIKLTASDPAYNDCFGNSVALNDSVALVGAFYKNGTYNQQGAAYLFDLNGNELKKLTSLDPTYNDRFGQSVALNDSVALVGAGYKNSSTGAAYLFDLNGNELKKLTPLDPAASDNFGGSVALNDSVALVGAYFKNGTTLTRQGAAYLFDAASGVQLKKLTASDPAANDTFGNSVALNSRYAVVGTYQKNNYQGAVYIFDLSGGAANAVQVAKLTSPNAPATEQFGKSVAIDEHSNVYVGANNASVNGFSYAGRAYKFTYVEAGLEDPTIGPSATWVHIDSIGVTAGDVALDWAFAPVTNVLKSSAYDSEIHVSTNLVDWLPPLTPVVTRGLLDEGVTVPKGMLPDSEKMFFKVRAVKF